METKDPRHYLETYGRIIAENKTHVAVVLRVEKATIARYLPLMAALADHSTAPSTFSSADT
jgi:hypothetical protein